MTDPETPISAALALPTGAYYTPKLAHIKLTDCIVSEDQGTSCISNATSQKPVIGTAAFNPCTALILYNTKTKTALVDHRARCFEQIFLDDLHKIRRNEDDSIEVHVIGAPISERDVEQNAHVLDYLADLAGIIGRQKNVALKTFDVYDKPKPHAIMIDCRNGNLIRGSKLYKTEERARSKDNLMHVEVTRDDFDGTLPEYQAKRHRG